MNTGQQTVLFHREWLSLCSCHPPPSLTTCSYSPGEKQKIIILFPEPRHRDESRNQWPYIIAHYEKQTVLRGLSFPHGLAWLCIVTRRHQASSPSPGREPWCCVARCLHGGEPCACHGDPPTAVASPGHCSDGSSALLPFLELLCWESPLAEGPGRSCCPGIWSGAAVSRAARPHAPRVSEVTASSRKVTAAVNRGPAGLLPSRGWARVRREEKQPGTENVL